MKLFSRIALIIAIVAGIGACFFASQLGAKRNGLRDNVAKLTTEKTQLTKSLADIHADLTNTKQEWEKTKEDLTTTRAVLDASNVKFATKAQEVDALKVALNGKTAELDQVKSDRDTALLENNSFKDSLAKANLKDISGIDQLRATIEIQSKEIEIFGKQLSAGRTERTTLVQRIDDLTNTPVNLRGHIAAVQDSWGFVVIDIGRDHRVQTNADFNVSRGDKIVAKIHVCKVGENTSVAEILPLPGLPKAQPKVGDTVVHD